MIDPHTTLSYREWFILNQTTLRCSNGVSPEGRLAYLLNRHFETGDVRAHMTDEERRFYNTFIPEEA